MSQQPLLQRLLEDLDESLWAVGYVGLYEFSWTLRGYREGLHADQIESLARTAYPLFRHAHDVELAYVSWPIDAALAESVGDAEELVFDWDPERDPHARLLVLFEGSDLHDVTRRR